MYARCWWLLVPLPAATEPSCRHYACPACSSHAQDCKHSADGEPELQDTLQQSAAPHLAFSGKCLHSSANGTAATWPAVFSPSASSRAPSLPPRPLMRDSSMSCIHHSHIPAWVSYVMHRMASTSRSCQNSQFCGLMTVMQRCALAALECALGYLQYVMKLMSSMHVLTHSTATLHHLRCIDHQPTCMSPGTARGVTTVCLFGLFMAEASLATSLLQAHPAEHVKDRRSSTMARSRAATDAPAQANITHMM